MKRKLPTVPDTTVSGINITPVINLCLVLLVVLLILSPMMNSPNLDIKLPEAQTEEQKEKHIAVTITPDGKIALNTESILPENLPLLLPILLREQGEMSLVVIRADKNVTYGTLTDLLKTIKEAGAKRISIGTKKPKDEELLDI